MHRQERVNGTLQPEEDVVLADPSLSQVRPPDLA